jgi:hypothetical protein
MDKQEIEKNLNYDIQKKYRIGVSFCNQRFNFHLKIILID